MKFLLGATLAFAIAALVGLGGTWLALERSVAFGAVRIGGWTSFPKTGTSDIDPYARALIARTGELPIGSGDGVAFVARSDDSGAPLDGRCDVVLSGITPPARFWTVTLYDQNGQLVGNAASRFGFTSLEIVRKSDSSFDIAIAPRARPGNWLPTGGIDRYILLLRLYDTPVGIATRASKEAPMPSIQMRACS